jgi:hypothetical protein
MSFKEIGTLSNEEIKQQLERIRRSKRFARASRSFRFLKFLVDGEQEGKEFSEEEIGRQVFDLPDDWVPLLDARVRGGRLSLQRYLDEYYNSEGVQDPVRIEVPAGSGYRAVSSWNPQALRDKGYSAKIAQLVEILINLWPILSPLQERKDLEDLLQRLAATER